MSVALGKYKNYSIEEICYPHSVNLIKEKLLTRRNILNNNYLTPCWIYTGCLTKKGYGVITIVRRNLPVHVLSFMIFKSNEYNYKLWVLHKCDIRSCFNPEHLYQGTNSNNMKDMWKRGRRKIKGD